MKSIFFYISAILIMSLALTACDISPPSDKTTGQQEPATVPSPPEQAASKPIQQQPETQPEQPKSEEKTFEQVAPQQQPETQPEQPKNQEKPSEQAVPQPTQQQPEKQLKPLAIQIDTSNLPKTTKTFSAAKSRLYKLYKGRHELTFYCGCKFDPDELTADLSSCNVASRKNPERARRIEAEHVFPAYWFGNFRRCWREPEQVCPQEGDKKISGRKCCEEVDTIFLIAHNDLHNLFPAGGEINGDRSNYSWGVIAGEVRNYGACDIEVDSSIRRAEPPENVRGNIARTMFYMSHTYGLKLSSQDIQLFNAWHKQDPEDAWELERNGLIEQVQGNRNPFIDGAVYDPNKIAKFPDVTYADIAHTETQPIPETPTTTAIDWSQFSCDTEKTCSRMDSCEEANYHLLACGNQNLDRDGDGVPCKSLCGDREPLKCDPSKKYCKHMADCNEAEFYLNVCGLSGLDRDGDGQPCASLCK